MAQRRSGIKRRLSQQSPTLLSDAKSEAARFAIADEFFRQPRPRVPHDCSLCLVPRGAASHSQSVPFHSVCSLRSRIDRLWDLPSARGYQYRLIPETMTPSKCRNANAYFSKGNVNEHRGTNRLGIENFGGPPVVNQQAHCLKVVAGRRPRYKFVYTTMPAVDRCRRSCDGARQSLGENAQYLRGFPH
jgi:hypothetical protein